MTPTDQTSTLLEILGGSFPTTKHSGGKYLKRVRWWHRVLFMTLFFTPNDKFAFKEIYILLYILHSSSEKRTPKTLIFHCHQSPSSKTSDTAGTNANGADSPSPRSHYHKLVWPDCLSKNTLCSEMSWKREPWSSSGTLTSRFLLPGTSAPSHPQSCSCRRPWSWTGQSLWSWSLHRRCRSPAGCCLSNSMFWVFLHINAFKMVLVETSVCKHLSMWHEDPPGFRS